MSREYRAYNEEFLQLMRNEAAWPKEVKVVPAIRKVLKGDIRNGDYGKLQEGFGLLSKATFFVTQRFFMPDIMGEKWKEGDDEVLRVRRLIISFLKSRGIEAPDKLQIAEIVSHLCDAPTTHKTRPTKPAFIKDAIMRGIEGILDAFGVKRQMNRHAQLCPEEKIEEAITWMFIMIARFISPDDAPPPREDAIAKAEQFMKTKLSNYIERAIEWQSRQAWTVVLARGVNSTKPAGVSIMLPLSEQAYWRILNAKQMTYDCRAEDIVVPSRLILHESLFEVPPDLGGSPIDESGSPLVRCALAQCAVLSRFSDPPRDKPLKLIAINGSEKARERLEGFGYTPTGKRMLGTGLQYYGKTISTQRMDGPDLKLKWALNFLSTGISGPPEP